MPIVPTLWQAFNQLPAWLLLVLGASLGVFARYGLIRFFPIEWQGILWINLIGCFGFGIGLGLMMTLPERFDSPAFRLFFLTGCMGALTTFSSYIFTLYQGLITNPNPTWGTLLLNIVLQHGLGLALLALGIWIVPKLLSLKSVYPSL